MRDLMILALLACLLFTFMLGNRPLSVPDEGRYVEIPREMTVTGDYLTPRLNYVKYFEKPILFYWLEAFSIKVFGLNEFTLRLWPALFGLFGVLGTALAGARLFGRRTGLLAAAVLATSLLYFAFSRAIILDMPVSVLLTLSLLCFLVGTHESLGLSRRLYLYAFYAFAALAVLAKGLIGILIPGMVIGAWILLLNEWRMLRSLYLVTGLALFFAIAAPWHILVSRANADFFHFYFIQEHFLRYLTKMHSRYQPMWFFIPVVLFGLFPWSGFLVQAVKHNLPASWKDRHEHRDALFLLLWAALVFLFFSASSSKLVPYILPVFAPVALLIGRYLSDSWDRVDFPGVRIGYAIVLAASLLLATAILALPVVWKSPEALVLGPYRQVFTITLAVGSVAAWLLSRYRGFSLAFIALTVMSAIFLLEMNAAAPLVDAQSSAKPIALALKARMKANEEVACYGHYYQDLPVYLEQRVTVADWNGELDYGRQAEDTGKWMIDGAALWKRWQEKAIMYVVMETGTYENLKHTNPRLKFYPIAHTERHIALCNKEVKP